MSHPITLDDLAAFNDQLSAIVGAGVPLEPGLEGLASERRDRLGKLCGRLAERMRLGASLEEALESEKGAVPPIYLAVVSAGIKSGRLPAALETMTNMALEMRSVRRQIGQAMVPPLLLAMLSYVLLVVFGLDLLERYRETFFQMELTPSLALRTLFAAGEWVARLWWLLPAILILACGWWSFSGGAGLLSLSGWSSPLALVPGVAAIVRNYRYVGFSKLLAMLCDHGVPFPESLRLAASTTGNRRFRNQAEQFARATERGDSLPKKSGWPQFLHWTLTSGARRDGLPKLLRHAAAIYRRRAMNYTLWLRTGLPIACTVIVGGSIVLGHMSVILGPMVALWWNLGRN